MAFGMKGFTMLRHRLTDEQWQQIAELFGPPAATGRPPRDRRQVCDAILWVLRTGSPWRDLPAAFGPWQTIWRLFDQWNGDGTLDAILDQLRGEIQINEQLWCIDGTTVRAHKCAAGGGKKGTPRNRPITPWAAAAAV
jgi:transposase